jgi:excinuclease ABC subunit A
VITGVSGSGKSSLAFDTLFAEGQRRYVESLSTYARQFIARMPRPEMDEIDNIPPAIALEQKNSVKNARSTIGSATEINDYLRLLFAKIGRLICPTTGEEAVGYSPGTAAAWLLENWTDKALYIVAPIQLQKKSLLKATLSEMQRQGFTRLLLDGEVVELDDPGFLSPKGMNIVPLLVDRVKAVSRSRGRLGEAIESAYGLAGGNCLVQSREGEKRQFSEQMRCPSCPGDCSHDFQAPSLQSLNFSSPLGACVTCQGFGRVTGLDWEKIIPNPGLSLNDGAVAPWSGEAGQECLKDLRRESKSLGVRMSVPWEDLKEEERDLIIHGKDKWYGIDGFFQWLEERRYKVQARVMLARYRGYSPCPDCGGYRLQKKALAVRVGGLHLGEVCDLSVQDLAAWINTLELTKEEEQVIERPLEEVQSRLIYLIEVGLGYLTLSRQTRTLSGGESQRINLATALGSALTETLYVLDEPTVGLHPRDTNRLLGILNRLTGLGNTVVVVEHDLDVIRTADYLLDIGPDAGEKGGELLYAGPPQGLDKSVIGSKTASYLDDHVQEQSHKKTHRGCASKYGRREPTGWITIHGAEENNLRSLTARIPLGVMCCITGVSGSGKSSLIKSCLYDNFRRQHHGDLSKEPGSILSLEGLHQVSDIFMVDQSPIGRSSRSNAATYLKAYDQIRTLLAGTPQAKVMGLKPRDFSFNVVGGRCEACEGTGRQTIDMHFLADVAVVCDVCEGRRFQDHILEVELEGLNISRILELTVNEALSEFRPYRRIRAGLEPLARVGLGYLRLGQSTATLSGGEAQRLKLAAHLAGATGSKNALLLFDEPTTGLHSADLDVLLGVFEQLIRDGYHLVIIEHNLQLIRRADYIIDLGPEGGEEGGSLVCEGTPEQICAHPESMTGKFLAEVVRLSSRSGEH